MVYISLHKVTRVSKPIPLRPTLRIQFVQVVERIWTNLQDGMLERGTAKERRLGPLHGQALHRSSMSVGPGGKRQLPKQVLKHWLDSLQSHPLSCPY